MAKKKREAKAEPSFKFPEFDRTEWLEKEVRDSKAGLLAVGWAVLVGLASWQSPGAVDRTEWVNQIRTVSTAGSSPYFIQESLHPNYWGQLAVRSCVRQAYNGGTPRGGTCVRSANGLVNGEPAMTLR